MKNKALGLVETKGLLGAMEAADAALKAANVTFIGFEKLKKDGLVTVKVTGDVGAVQAAVEAGSAAARKLNCLFNSHVIARLHEETAKIVTIDSPQETPNEQPVEDIQIIPLQLITEDKKPKTVILADQVQDVSAQQNVSAQEEKQDKTDLESQGQDQLEEATSLVSSGKKKEKPLDEMKLAELRKIAYKLKLTTISKVQVKYAKKDQLIKAIEQHDGEKE
ncbi:BMC domain-containing protein [Brevibacillus laterosporus]|uniref:BMC domain-containing protein n=1 Tax=Brevibacillus laterosporus TaxID=1465 RepID=A0A502I2U2_BRELA|nr:BMC domain-containing protein [Brevibacillus laterosporus]QDX94400.1 BMC domain-containing protein [Brevibacillus laterosporus]RAP31054.1 hypothetical protein C2W64_00226 [Brevibacillus laterosporus]TPG79946.1 BMC domain-containing protein [Brevibacillus laterosporus]